MKKLLVLFLICTINQNLFSQNCDKIVEWNLDSGITQKGLPYNQSICFKLKSKTVPLDKVTDVLLIEHHGKMNALQSAKYYAKHDNVPKKFYVLTKGEFDKENKILPVALDENPRRPGPEYVLQPSKQYSIFLLTSEPEAAVTGILGKIKTYLDSLKAGSPDTTRMYLSIDTSYQAILKIKDGSALRPAYFSYTTADTLLDAYKNEVYRYDSTLDRAKAVVQSFNDFTKKYDCDLPYDVSTLVEKNLSRVLEKEGCVSQLPCVIDKCTLYKYMVALQNRMKFAFNRDTSVLGNFIMGNCTLTDLINPLFIEKKEPELSSKIANIDSLIVQLSNIKLYLNSLFINDCKIYSCCDSTQKYYPLSINTAINNYSGCLDSVLGRLKVSKQFLQNWLEMRTKKDKQIKDIGFSLAVIQLSSANTYTYGLEPRNKLIIMPVLGYAYYGFQKSFSSFTPYTGILVSFASLDDDVPFRLLKHKTPAQRLGFLLGVTLSSIKEENKRDNLFSNGTNLMFGLGFKASHVVNLNGGIFLFKKDDPNPFITTKKITTTPFLSVSLNLKLQSLFSSLTGLLPNK